MRCNVCDSETDDIVYVYDEVEQRYRADVVCSGCSSNIRRANRLELNELNPIMGIKDEWK